MEKCCRALENHPQWVGSNSFCTGCKITYAINPFNYSHHEEQYITNANDTIFLNYNASVPDPNIVKNATSAHANMIARYELSYRKGKVIGLGLYSDVVINNRHFLMLLDHLLASLPVDERPGDVLSGEVEQILSTLIYYFIPGIDYTIWMAIPRISQFEDESSKLSIIKLEDALDFDKYSQNIANIIINSTPKSAVRIFAGWGAGKTSLMCM